MKHLAIVGTGLAGLALAFFLKGRLELSLFDAQLSSAASSMPHALCHPFVGLSSKLNFRGKEALEKSQRLFDLASEARGRSLYKREGLIRFALDERQQREYKEAAKQYEEVSWFEADDSPYAPIRFPGIFIRNALSLDAGHYLEGLKTLIDLPIERKEITRGALSPFDAVIFATGAETKSLFPELPLRLIKGQQLQFPFKGRLPSPIMSRKYFGQEGNSLWVGATYERIFTDSKPDEAFALAELFPEALRLFPELEGASPLQVKAAVRCFTPEQRPCFKQVSEKEWVFTGFGSKGLLYHALFAEEAASRFLE